MGKNWVMGILFVWVSLIFSSSLALANSECVDHGLIKKSDVKPDELIYSDSNLWRVTSPNGDSGVIFGTIHTTNKRIVGRYSFLQSLLYSADVYFPELDLSESGVNELVSSGNDQQELNEKYSPEINEKILQVLKERGQSYTELNKKKDWYLFSALSRPYERGYSIDHTLWQQAAGLPRAQVIPLESMTSLVSALENLKHSKDIVKDVVCDYKNVERQFSNLENYFYNNEWNKFRLEAVSWTSANNDVSVEFNQKLVADRNLKMAETVEKTLKGKQKFLLTVGLSHLPGKSGLLAELERRGYKIEKTLPSDFKEEVKKINKSVFENKVKDIRILLSWIKVFSNYNTSDESIPLPEFDFKTPEELQEIACGGMECPVLAFYHDKKIYINTGYFLGFMNNDVGILGVVLHELTHWVQEQYGTYTNDYSQCNTWRDREMEAYTVQSQYLYAMGSMMRATAFLPPPSSCQTDQESKP